ncbi:MAG TPA: MGMT family protein [Anaerolineaceae bacterium]|nr:MGMT family protein [Anaerolineaceae bacterium]
MAANIPEPPDREAFYSTVWAIVRQIPPGRVATYGQIGALIPPPAGVDPATYAAFRARWVGSAMSASPPDVPWQRVINAQGKVSLRRSGPHSQRALLEAEGVPFDAKERVDLGAYGWAGPDAAFRQAHGLTPPPEAGQEHQESLF